MCYSNVAMSQSWVAWKSWDSKIMVFWDVTPYTSVQRYIQQVINMGDKHVMCLAGLGLCWKVTKLHQSYLNWLVNCFKFSTGLTYIVWWTGTIKILAIPIYLPNYKVSHHRRPQYLPSFMYPGTWHSLLLVPTFGIKWQFFVLFGM